MHFQDDLALNQWGIVRLGQVISMVIIGVKSGSAVASAIPLPGLHRNTQKLKNQESLTRGDKEISA